MISLLTSLNKFMLGLNIETKNYRNHVFNVFRRLAEDQKGYLQVEQV